MTAIVDKEQIALALAPLAAFWVAFQCLWSAAKFVNDMRETIVIGRLNSEPLDLHHRRTIYFDWKLTMMGTITAAVMFGGITFWIGLLFTRAADTLLHEVGILLLCVSAFPWLVALCYIVCGVSDSRLISSALREAISLSERNKLHELNPSEGNTVLAQPETEHAVE